MLGVFFKSLLYASHYSVALLEIGVEIRGEDCKE